MKTFLFLLGLALVSGEKLDPTPIVGPSEFVGLTDDYRDATRLSMSEAFKRGAKKLLRKANQWVADDGDLALVNFTTIEGEAIGEAYAEAYRLQNTSRGFDTFEDLSRIDVADSDQRLSIQSLSLRWPCFYNWYRCPAGYRYLWAFPGPNAAVTCFIPWPRLQLIRYAYCLCPYCWFRLNGSVRGRCLESPFQLRRFLVACVSCNGRWWWTYQTRWVPTGCTCRTC